MASDYNAMIALGKTEMLSETIYSFEKWAIEFAIAWGNFGSNATAFDIGDGCWDGQIRF